MLKPTLPFVLLILTAAAAAQEKAFTGARIIDGTGKAALENATLLVNKNGSQTKSLLRVRPRQIRVPSGTTAYRCLRRRQPLIQLL